MEFQIIWFVLWGVLWAAYFMTDGFDLGIGILYPFLGKTDGEKRTIINTIGPVWGRQRSLAGHGRRRHLCRLPRRLCVNVQLSLYRAADHSFCPDPAGVAFEFRGKGSSETWKKGWDWAIFLVA